MARSPSSFRTMDGRTVTSKNPFSSPVTMNDGSPESLRRDNNAPSFPSNADFRDTPPAHNMPLPAPRHLLHKRNAPSNPPPLRDGFPARTGRYSFTGSPIEEAATTQLSMDTDETDLVPSPPNPHNNKKRRLDHDDDAFSLRMQLLSVSTHNLPPNNDHEDISPTDILHFPPPTPTKTTHYNSNRYTPVHNTQPPQTPLLDRRRPLRRTPLHSSSNEDNDSYSLEEQLSAGKKQTHKSRFESDFEVIGQLGKGSFGKVFKVLSKLDGCMYAVKTALRAAKGQADKDRMLKEVYALAALSECSG